MTNDSANHGFMVEWRLIGNVLLELGKENTLTELEREPLPDDLEVIRQLINEHQDFMDGLSARQPEIDSVCKPMRPKSTAPSSRRTSRIGGRVPG